MTLWENQVAGLDGIESAIEAGYRRILVTSPTGGGKSRMMFEFMKRQTDNVVLHTDRTLLFSQLSSEQDKAGIPHGHLAAGFEPSNEQIQLAMVQTLVSRSVKGERMVHPAKVILWDEAHKMVADGAINLRERYGDVIDIGFTATPLGVGHVYDHLVVAGTNSELRKAGKLVPCYHYGPDQPDTKLIGKVAVDGGECGIAEGKRMHFASRVFGSVMKNYQRLNGPRRPTLLFAPGVNESAWFAESLRREGLRTAHVDSTKLVINGETMERTTDRMDSIKADLESGSLDVVCNRFVLREGIDWPFVSHLIFATVFGSLTSYLQAGGRGLRASKGKFRCVVQDHGANGLHHGSLNSDRVWQLIHTDRLVQQLRVDRLRQKKESEPIVCPNCDAYRLSGATCHECGYICRVRTRKVLQADGTLREVKGDFYRQRKMSTDTERARSAWVNRVRGCKRSKKPTVQRMTFAQLETAYARDNYWAYPRRDWPMMPKHEMDWFIPIAKVRELTE